MPFVRKDTNNDVMVVFGSGDIGIYAGYLADIDKPCMIVLDELIDPRPIGEYLPREENHNQEQGFVFLDFGDSIESLDVFIDRCQHLRDLMIEYQKEHSSKKE